MKYVNLFLLIFVVSCTYNVQKYKYLNNFESYLHDTFGHKIIENRIYYLLPLNSCEPCVDQNLQMLANESKNEKIIPILIGVTTNKVWLDLINKMNSNFSLILEDKNGESKHYVLGIGKPILIHYYDYTRCNFMLVSENKIDLAKKYLDEL